MLLDRNTLPHFLPLCRRKAAADMLRPIASASGAAVGAPTPERGRRAVQIAEIRTDTKDQRCSGWKKSDSSRLSHAIVNHIAGSRKTGFARAISVGGSAGRVGTCASLWGLRFTFSVLLRSWDYFHLLEINFG